MAAKSFDMVIVGGGVTGTAVLYVASQFSNVQSIALIEKYSDVAQVNSSPKNNSQTLHFGDIETNYSLEHALPIKDAGELMANYVQQHPLRGLFQITSKMVLAVGEEEVASLKQRFEDFKGEYPGLELLDAARLAEIEPNVMTGRNPSEPVLAMLSHDGYAINYQALSKSFLHDAQETDKSVELFFDTHVDRIAKNDTGYTITMKNSQGEHTISAKAVVVASGPFSLLFAQSLGYGRNLGILPVAGSFYFSRRVLCGKVYTMQIEGLPFAAVHGDPDVTVEDATRFGPTAKVVPLLERHKYSSMSGFMRRPIMTVAGLFTLCKIMSDLVVAKFIIRNFVYDFPLIGKALYLRQVRKVVPSMKWKDLRLGKGLGGLRPQVVDTKNRTMHMGESKIVGDHIIFNTTPSPGASIALKNAESDVRLTVASLGEDYAFDQAEFNRQFRPVHSQL